MSGILMTLSLPAAGTVFHNSCILFASHSVLYHVVI